MDNERPPQVDAEYRVVHGAWPRWAMQLGLAKLALWVVAVVMMCIAVAVVAFLVLTPR